MNTHLKTLEQKSIFIIREAHSQCKKPALLWSLGKDSTSLLWLVRKAFMGTVPFPVIHIDTGYKFPQMYEFRDRFARAWKIKLIIARNEAALKRGVHPDSSGRFACCDALKTEALKKCVARNDFDALLLGIRRDEHAIRAKERYFSPRNAKFKWDYAHQPPEFMDIFDVKIKKGIHHYRVHPLLHWTEIDVWEYIRSQKIPVNPLYFSRKGKRYRSLGCMPCTTAVISRARTVKQVIDELTTSDTSERAGRAQDKEKEYMMQKLRSLGYM